jgi:PEP-CTERM motif
MGVIGKSYARRMSRSPRDLPAARIIEAPMNIRRTQHLQVRVFVLTVLVLLAPWRSARAEFALSTSDSLRFFSDSGTLVQTISDLSETLDGLTLGSNGIIYTGCNELGFANVHRFYSNAARVDPPPFPGPYGTFASGFTIPGSMAFGPGGDLFETSVDFQPFQSQFGEQRVVRIDGQTGALKSPLPGSIPGSASPTVFLRDIQAAPGNELYVGESDGTIQRYSIGPSSATIVKTLNTGIQGLRWMTLGLDGLLYIRESINNSIVRYDPNAMAVVDTFVASVPMTNTFDTGIGPAFATGDIFFGPGGDLFALNNSTDVDGHVVRFDGQTGNYKGVMFSVPAGGADPTKGMTGLGFYLAVPEPGSLPLAIIGTTIVGAWLAVRRKPMPFVALRRA